MIDEAFAALKTFDWGNDVKQLAPIEEAVVQSRDDPAARRELERRLIAVLRDDVSHAAKDYVCRQLHAVGTAEAVPALAELLGQEDLSHLARLALTGIPDPRAAQALRDALSQLNGKLKVGVIASLGDRQDEASVPLLGRMLADSDESVARAAALALAAIRTPAAAKALRQAAVSSASVQAAVTDATLACAESYLAAGRKAEALALYKSLTGGERPRHVRLATTRGMMLASAGQTE